MNSNENNQGKINIIGQNSLNQGKVNPNYYETLTKLA